MFLHFFCLLELAMSGRSLSLSLPLSPSFSYQTFCLVPTVSKNPSSLSGGSFSLILPQEISIEKFQEKSRKFPLTVFF